MTFVSSRPLLVPLFMKVTEEAIFQNVTLCYVCYTRPGPSSPMTELQLDTFLSNKATNIIHMQNFTLDISTMMLHYTSTYSTWANCKVWNCIVRIDAWELGMLVVVGFGSSFVFKHLDEGRLVGSPRIRGYSAMLFTRCPAKTN